MKTFVAAFAAILCAAAIVHAVNIHRERAAVAEAVRVQAILADLKEIDRLGAALLLPRAATAERATAYAERVQAFRATVAAAAIPEKYKGHALNEAALLISNLRTYLGHSGRTEAAAVLAGL